MNKTTKTIVIGVVTVVLGGLLLDRIRSRGA